jgi:predicted helicase
MRSVTGTIHAVLDRLRDEALDERDKGSKFEQLIRAYLTTDPEWTARFSDVWMWSDWPGRAGRPDTGIDLVAANADGDGLTAIQCKFYASGRTVAKADIDSFVSASASSAFTRRIVFDTAAAWSANAEETLTGGVAQRVDIGYLADAAIDWSQFSWATPEIVVPTGRKALRPHQQKALDDVRAGLVEHDRGQLVMACGTGKTFTSLRIAEELVGAGGTVLFLVPSIQLLSQSLREWMANAEVELRPLAVCSDVRVGRRAPSDDADQLPIDLTEPASTDPQTLLTRFEAGPAAGRMRVPAATEFGHFVAGLRGNLNNSITDDAAIDMLAQHLITRPVFEALFARSSFLAGNPVARCMENMLAVLDAHALDAENETLEGFYDTVRKRVAGVNDASGKQKVLTELYDKFFATAFPKTVAKLGIVYTPVEIVDFILRSADEVLRAEFGQGLTDEGVHVLDPFTGTGTFLVRLLQSGLIEPHDLARKYTNELHANEILLLAYYIAAANIETTFEDLERTPRPFPGLVLTDTFQSWEHDDQQDIDVMPENNERLERQKQLPIQVIIGNPPYSAGQDSANDDNANEKYPTLDAAIRDTYAARSTAKLKNSLYDSYIRAFKWAALRLGDRGVVAFVTNGGFLESNVADGMRQTLVEEFSAVHVFNLRGNQRTAGELSRREGGKIFDSGSRATVAITVLVKNSG